MNRSVLLIIGISSSLAALNAPAIALDGGTGVAIQARTGTVNLDFVNADVTDVVRALAAQSKINVALNPSVHGQITVHLRGKSVTDALSVVTNLAGLGFKRVNDTYVIAPRAEMKPTLERLGVKREVTPAHLPAAQAADMANNAFPDLTARVQGNSVSLAGAPEDINAAESLIHQMDEAAPDQTRSAERFEVKNRPAADVAKTLAKMYPSCAIEAVGNAVMVGGPKSDIEQAKTSVAMLDVVAQPDGETRVYHVRYAHSDQLIKLLNSAVPEVLVVPGPDSYTPPGLPYHYQIGNFTTQGTTGSTGGAGGGGGGGGAGGGNGGTQAGAGKIPLTLLLKGPRAALDEAMNILAQTDTAPRQMLIEARVIDSSPEFIRNLGVDWSWNPFQFTERPSVSGHLTPPNPSTGSGGANVPLGPLGFGSFGRVQFTPTAVLSALQTDKRSKLLASPQIAVVNDQDASIFIGDTLRYQALAQSSPTTGTLFTVVEVPVGIILLVHPRVNDEGNITLRVHPVVSTVTGFSDGLPQTSAREAETVVRVKDGDTIVIGGLIRDEDIKSFNKVPILGDLPLLGYLFRSESRDHRRSEVTVFLTIKMLPG